MLTMKGLSAPASCAGRVTANGFAFGPLTEGTGGLIRLAFSSASLAAFRAALAARLLNLPIDFYLPAHVVLFHDFYQIWVHNNIVFRATARQYA